MNIPVLALDKLFSCHRRRNNSCKYSLFSNTCLVLWKRKRNDNSLQEMLFIHVIPHLWERKKNVQDLSTKFFSFLLFLVCVFWGFFPLLVLLRFLGKNSSQSRKNIPSVSFSEYSVLDYVIFSLLRAIEAIQTSLLGLKHTLQCYL